LLGRKEQAPQLPNLLLEPFFGIAQIDKVLLQVPKIPCIGEQANYQPYRNDQDSQQ
jgi:hypothetical protein